jgi:hypothetical protein
LRSFETEQDDGPRAPLRAAGVIDESAAERTRECVRCYCISQALKAVESNGMLKGTREVAEKYSIDRRLLTTQEDAAARELGEAAVDVHGLSRQAVSLLSSSGSTKRFCCIQLHSATPSLWCSIVCGSALLHGFWCKPARGATENLGSDLSEQAEARRARYSSLRADPHASCQAEAR